MELTWRNFWFESKAAVKELIGVSEGLIHVHFGLATFLVLALLLRKYQRGALIAWFIVAGLQFLNEAMDARDWINWTGTVNWPEVTSDTFATLFWPTVLLLLWRHIGWRNQG